MTDLPEGVFHPEKLDELLRLSKKISTSVQALKLAGHELNVKDYTQVAADLKEYVEKFSSVWQHFTEVDNAFGEQAQDFLNSPDYPQQLVSALETYQVTFSGDFPNYELPPFKLSIKLDQSLAKLSLGRKNQQTYSLSPTTLAAWVSKNYKALINSSFNQERFCKELLTIYPYLSRDQWGVPVPIKEVYTLLTLKTETKQEYPESRFIFDLSRLLEQYEIKYNEYTFDFSSHKQSGKNYTVVNQQGRERAISSMTIRRTAGLAQDIDV